MNGGVLDCPDGDQAVRLYANDGVVRDGKSVMVMTGGEIRTNGIWCNISEGSGQKGKGIELTISGGVVNGMLDFTSMSDQVKIDITGGTFNGRIRVRAENDSTLTKPYINISGGNWTLSEIKNRAGGAVPREKSIRVSGGTFDHDPSSYYGGINYVEDGYVAKEVDDSTWTVVSE
jgi:hypothetical protein